MTRLAGHGSGLGLGAAGVALGILGGWLFGRDFTAGALLVGTVLLLLLVAVRPSVIGLVAVGGTFAAYRVGAGAGLPVGNNGVSYADLLLLLAVAVAVPQMVVGPELKRLRGPLVGLGVYLACLLPTVLTDSSSRGPVEWAHRLMLIGGAVVVGAWIAREGLVRTAFRILLALGCVLALAAVATTFRTGFEPAYPLGLHKNFAGAQLSMVVILLVAAPRQIGLHGRGQALFLAVVVAGLISTQSRGSMLAAAAGIFLFFAAQPRAQSGGARAFVVLVALALGGFVYFSIQAQLDLSTADLNNSSIGVRRQVEERAREIWRTSPFTGVGLKYFNSGEWGPLAQPANVVVDSELAESGIIGLFGFSVLQVSLLRAGWARRRTQGLAIVGSACTFALLIHGLVDIYWIAGSVALPFLVLGMTLSSDPELENSAPIPGSASEGQPSRPAAVT